MRDLSRICVVAFGGLFAVAGWSQDYPTKSLKLIAANSPGSPPDVVARITAPALSRLLGQPIVVENKPGAGSIIGYEFVAKQPADGYTVGVVQVPSLAILPATVKDLRFDPIKDLPPVITLAEGQYALVTASGQPWKSFGEMVSFAKANPGKLSYGSSSPLVRLPMEALLREAGIAALYVPYSAAGPYYQGIVSSEVHLGLAAESTALSFREKLKVLAVTGRRRSALFADAPTFSEIGNPHIPGLAYSLNVAAGTPKTIVEKLHVASLKMLQQPEVIGTFAKLQMEVIADSPEVAERRLADTAKFLSEVAKRMGMKPE